MAGMNVTLNTIPIQRFLNSARGTIEGSDRSSPFGRSFIIAGWEIVAYLHDRFYSGGGDKPWAALKAETVNKKGHGVILIESSELQEAFSLDGAKVTRVGGGVSITLKNAPHGDRGKTIPQIAEHHQSGLGRVPVRKVFVEPDSRTLAKVAATVKAGVRQTLRETGAGS